MEISELTPQLHPVKPAFGQVYVWQDGSQPDLPPCPVDTEVTDGDVIDFGGGAQVVSVPGHTDGSVAIWLAMHGVLFTGDVVANGRAGVMLGPFNTDRARSRESVMRLRQLPAQTVCFGHGDPLTDAGAWRELGRRSDVPDPLG